MDVSQFCEIIMLFLFGISWPFNISKSLKSKMAKGKSILFEVIVVIGYTFGLIGKFLSFRATGILVYSTWFYLADIVMVLIDLMLCVKNSDLDRKRQ